MATVKDVLDRARSQLGVCESPPRSSRTPYTEWYNLTADWCAMFVSWCLYHEGVSLPGPKGTASTEIFAAWFKKRGKWTRKPAPGHIIFFKWPTCAVNRTVCHVGIVESVKPDGTVVTIEGNTSDCVKRRNRRYHIVGYGIPIYESSDEDNVQQTRRIDVVARGGGNDLYQKYYVRGKGWSGWVNLGAPTGDLTSEPTICSWEPRRLDIFARGANNQLVHKWFANNQWSDWEDLGGILSSAPDAISWGTGRIDVVARGGGNDLYQKYYVRGKGWSGWVNLGAPTGGLTSEPTICSWEPRRLDIFARGANNQLVHKWFANNQWSDWEDLGGILSSAPDAISWGTGRIDVVARGGGNDLYQKYYVRGKGWSGWVNLGAPTGDLTSAPTICSWEPRRLDIFARGANNQLVHKWFANNQWSDWEDLGGILSSAPDATS